MTPLDQELIGRLVSPLHFQEGQSSTPLQHIGLDNNFISNLGRFQITKVHVDGYPVTEGLAFGQGEGNGGNVVDQQSTEASMKRSSAVGVLLFDAKAGHAAPDVALHKTTLNHTQKLLYY